MSYKHKTVLGCSMCLKKVSFCYKCKWAFLKLQFKGIPIIQIFHVGKLKLIKGLTKGSALGSGVVRRKSQALDTLSTLNNDCAQLGSFSSPPTSPFVGRRLKFTKCHHNVPFVTSPVSTCKNFSKVCT